MGAQSTSPSLFRSDTPLQKKGEACHSSDPAALTIERLMALFG
jgi:hypothetical protein